MAMIQTTPCQFRAHQLRNMGRHAQLSRARPAVRINAGRLSHGRVGMRVLASAAKAPCSVKFVGMGGVGADYLASVSAYPSVRFFGNTAHSIDLTGLAQQASFGFT